MMIMSQNGSEEANNNQLVPTVVLANKTLQFELEPDS